VTLADSSLKTKEAAMMEYTLIAKLNSGPSPSPGLVPTPTLHEEDGIRNTLIYPLFTMDMFEGLSLYAVENRTAGVSETVARIWLAQLLHAVRHMAKKNVAHRDIKLENCLLTTAGNVVLSDLELGLECTGEGGMEVGVEILGTPM
jgi:serine/threonine protein kinase